MPEKPPKPLRNRAQKSLDALGGDDDFSTGKGAMKKPKVVLAPRLEEQPVPQEVPAPTREGNLFIRLFARIFR